MKKDVTAWSSKHIMKVEVQKAPAVLQLTVCETFVFVLCSHSSKLSTPRQSPSAKYQRRKVSGSFSFAFLPYFIQSLLLPLVKLFKCSFLGGRRRTVKMPLSFLFFSFYLQMHNYLRGNYRPCEGTSFTYSFRLTYLLWTMCNLTICEKKGCGSSEKK